jgi:hypothetical protein
MIEHPLTDAQMAYQKEIAIAQKTYDGIRTAAEQIRTAARKAFNEAVASAWNTYDEAYRAHYEEAKADSHRLLR